MNRFRSEAGLVKDTLLAIENNPRPSEHDGWMLASNVVTNTKTAYEDCIKRLDKLTALHLLEKQESGKNVLYRITPKGQKFLRELLGFEQRFAALGIDINLRT